MPCIICDWSKVRVRVNAGQITGLLKEGLGIARNCEMRKRRWVKRENDMRKIFPFYPLTSTVLFSHFRSL